MEHLQVIFKVVERCNINCDYCYYFNMGDLSPLGRPPRVDADFSGALASWLAAGIQDLDVRRLSVCFHGGEPMLLRVGDFESICRELRARLDESVQLRFNIQTNGTIMSEEWLDALSRHSVHVGVSIDGDRAMHDRHRLDHRGKSTFDRTIKNLVALIERARQSDPQIGPATISVLDCRNDYAEVYRYLRGLGVRRMSFLLPDRNYDAKFSTDDDSALKYGKALFDIFEAWMIEDDPSIFIRFITETLQHFQVWEDGVGARSYGPRVRYGESVEEWATQIIIVHSDGTVGIDDSFTPALDWYKQVPNVAIAGVTLKDFLGRSLFTEIERARESLSSTCQACKWRRICRGGDLENRFSSSNGFDNPSLYCDGYKYYLEHVCDVLIENGYPRQEVQRLLGG